MERFVDILKERKRTELRLSDYAFVINAFRPKTPPKLYTWYLYSDRITRFKIDGPHCNAAYPLEGIALTMYQRAVAAHINAGGKEADLVGPKVKPPVTPHDGFSDWVVVHPRHNPEAIILPFSEALLWATPENCDKPFPYL